MYHEHPLRILRYSAKNIWLLIFPLLRGMKAYRLDVNKLYTWLRGAWFDIAVVGIIILFGFIRWYFSRIIVTDEFLMHSDGVFVKRKKSIPYAVMSVVNIERPLYLRIFGGMRFFCSTCARYHESADIKLMINKKVVSEIMKNIPLIEADKEKIYRHRPDLISVILFSLFFSSSLSGALYVAAFFFKGGDVARDIISVSLERITYETSKLTGFLITKIPDAAIGAGLFFIATWLLSFILNIFRYSCFSVRSDERRIELVCGVLTRRSYNIETSKINYTDLRQNLVMKLFKAVSVNICCAGYGGNRRHAPVILPLRKENGLSGKLENMGAVYGHKNEFRPKLTSVWQYIWIPVIAVIGIYPSALFVKALYPEFSRIMIFAVIMTEIPSVWMLFVKLAAAVTSRVSVSDKKIMLCCSYGFKFHTIIAEHKNITEIVATQTLFQKISKKCSLKIYFKSNRIKGYAVKGISVNDAEKIAILLGYSCELDKI